MVHLSVPQEEPALDHGVVEAQELVVAKQSGGDFGPGGWVDGVAAVEGRAVAIEDDRLPGLSHAIVEDRRFLEDHRREMHGVARLRVFDAARDRLDRSIGPIRLRGEAIGMLVAAQGIDVEIPGVAGEGAGEQGEGERKFHGAVDLSSAWTWPTIRSSIVGAHGPGRLLKRIDSPPS